jgi:hypothetical protein
MALQQEREEKKKKKRKIKKGKKNKKKTTPQRCWSRTLVTIFSASFSRGRSLVSSAINSSFLVPRKAREADQPDESASEAVETVAEADSSADEAVADADSLVEVEGVNAALVGGGKRENEKKEKRN